MGDQKSDDWLPEGWRMEMKVRKNGKKDKCYFPPSGGVKFFSKLEVSRYLSNCHPKSEEKENGIDQQSSKNVVIEKVTPEGLPPGWTKEIKVTKKAHKTRRDPFYTDPVSGYVFRSMKDALRYLETGEVGRLAFKPRDKDNNDVELEDDNTCSPTVAKKQKLASSGTSPTTSDKSLKLCEIAKDEHIPNTASTEDSMVTSECGVRNESSSSELPDDKGSDLIEGRSDSAKNVFVVDPVSRVLPDKQSFGSGVIRDETKMTGLVKSEKKNDFHLPRRASKRLAGVPLDPTPELKTANRGRRATVKQANEIVATTGEGSSPDQHDPELQAPHAFDTSKRTKILPEPKKSKHPTGNVATPNDHSGNAETEINGDEKHDFSVVLSQGNLAIAEDCAGKSATDSNTDEKPALPLDLPLGELWHDPCIAFAIKTLTGVSLDNYDSMTGSDNSGSGGFMTLEGHARNKDTGNVGYKDQECPVVRPPGDLDVPGTQTYEKPESLVNLPFVDAWADPCIEFAIKTLTGAIPLDCNMVFQDYLPQQASSSQPQGISGLSLPNAGEFCQTELFCQQYVTSDEPLFNEAALVEPALPMARNANRRYSNGANRRERSEREKRGMQ